MSQHEPFVTAVIPSHLVREAVSMGIEGRELDEICPLPPERWFQFEQTAKRSRAT